MRQGERRGAFDMGLDQCRAERFAVRAERRFVVFVVVVLLAEAMLLLAWGLATSR